VRSQTEFGNEEDILTVYGRQCAGSLCHPELVEGSLIFLRGVRLGAKEALKYSEILRQAQDDIIRTGDQRFGLFSRARQPSLKEMGRFLGRVIAIFLFLPGVLLLTWGVVRYRLPYENGRYFDPEKQVVYHAQTAEAFVIIGMILTLVGLVIVLRAFCFNRRGNQYR